MDDPVPLVHARKPWIPLLVSVLLMLGFGALVTWQWQILSANSKAEQQRRFALEVAGIEQSVRERMLAYEMVLRGMSGLVAGSDDVSFEEWRRASEQLQLQERYPGIQALSWNSYLHSGGVESFVERTRAQGRPEFQAFPPGERDDYLVVNFIYPLDWRNRRAIGFDMYSEATRREAISRARDSGEAVLTGPLHLRQETEQDVQTGLLLYLPVYRQDIPQTSLDERRTAVLGMVAGTFRVADLMRGILGRSSELFEIGLVDAGDTGNPLLKADGEQAHEARFQVTRELDIYGRTWQLQVSSTPRYEASMHNSDLSFSLFSGLLAALLLSVSVGGYLFLRERTLSRSESQSRMVREREERFRLVVEASPNAIVLADQKGRISMVNRQTELLFGYARDELLGEPVEKLLPEAIRAAHVGLRAGYQAAPEPRRMGGNRELFGQHRDGRMIPLEVGLSPLRSGDELLVQAVIIDISARKAAEERFRQVVEASPNAILLVDSQGRVAMVNRQTELMFGYTRAELLGQAVEMLLPESLRGAHPGLRQGFFRDPSPRSMGSNRELFGQHRDGQLIPLEVGLSPLRSGDELLVQAVIIDISERRAAEQRLREQAEQLALANRYKSEFLANMSHELRTPLNSILILSEQLKQNMAGNLTEKQVKHADIIYKAGNDLLQLINDVLDLAKIEAGRVQLKLEPLNVHDMLVELDSSLRPMAEIKGLRLLSNLEPGVPRMIHTDRGRLHQILRNLLSNALKFTEKGEVELSISRSDTSLDDERETLEIVVRDTGIGIAAEQHERIFQAFQQIDGSTSRRFGGTGLGLAITRQLVEVLGGQIRLDSVLGGGSRFTVLLPVVALAHSETDDSLSSAPLRSGQGPAVLVVEDDLNFASVIAEEAQAHGFSCVLCRSGKQAIGLLQGERFVAVILDILLPDISGWQIYRRLRSLVQYRDIPVHIVSCVPQPQDWQEDGTRYLVKPIGRSELEQVFQDIGMAEVGSFPLLLVEDVEVEREHYREHLQQLGFGVTAVGTAEAARDAYLSRNFGALVIDLDLPDQDGFDLLEALHRERPLQATQVVINTGVDITRSDLQRLRRYSAVVVRKSGDDLQPLSAALQRFLSTVREPQLDSSGLSGKRVLLVDDDVRNIYAMTALLDEVGLAIVPARDGLEALACFAREPFDLVLMDMAMPNMDGYTATRILKEERDCQIPVIALTAHAMKGDREKCITAGADDYLAKPVGRQELLEMLHRWLSDASEPQLQARG
ncbi:hybrid sensor histidine kinase/response regulator [Pseudomonas alcaligenes]|uniref:histidine kinase n=1 Tax=Aquipseudomonas alcaligenes TaxID=43263 RepID=A0ABR7RZ55_AQUAC|nr:CHASE domain-containing protein [Pseudomonas alcaligenes]MBC9249752.1 hybrid sensor histidine kinase/response regulator [Pseudomonas alcaligenes]